MQTIHKLISLLLLLALLASQGCVAAAIGYTGYAISSSKKEAAQKEADAHNIQTYDTYKADAEKLNIDRQKSGLKPQPIMTFSEWKLAHNITTPAPPPTVTAQTDNDKKE